MFTNKNRNGSILCSRGGKSCPAEILETLAMYNVEGRSIWKPMHMQPIYQKHSFVTCGEKCRM